MGSSILEGGRGRGARLLVTLVLGLCLACQRPPGAPPAPDAPGGPTETRDSSSKAGANGKVSAARAVAQVDAVLHAHVLAPSESLAVRLLGTVGPDGNWSLQELRVERTDTGVRITPVVQQGSARQVIQMVLSLDRVVWVHLPEGTHTVEVKGRDSTFTDRVQVAPGLTRPPPETRMAYQVVTAGVRALDFITFDALPGDGFIEAIEIRETRAGGPGAWRRLEDCQREGANLSGRLQVQENDDLHTIESRAVDGQGDRDPQPALINLSSP